MTILKIDSREPEHMKRCMVREVSESDIIDNYEIVELETADFVCESIGVERKQASDYNSSVQDRRISEQADRMTEEFDHRYVVVEEHPFNLKYGGVGDRSMIGQQVSLAAKRDIRQVITDDIEGTAYAVRRIVERSLQDESVGHVKTADVETDDVQVAMLAQVSGITADKAEAIIDEISFSELADCATDIGYEGPDIAREAVKEVDGIGATLADRIINAFQ